MVPDRLGTAGAERAVRHLARWLRLCLLGVGLALALLGHVSGTAAADHPAPATHVAVEDCAGSHGQADPQGGARCHLHAACLYVPVAPPEARPPQARPEAVAALCEPGLPPGRSLPPGLRPPRTA